MKKLKSILSAAGFAVAVSLSSTSQAADLQTHVTTSAAEKTCMQLFVEMQSAFRQWGYFKNNYPDNPTAVEGAWIWYTYKKWQYEQQCGSLSK